MDISDFKRIETTDAVIDAAHRRGIKTKITEVLRNPNNKNLVDDLKSLIKDYKKYLNEEDNRINNNLEKLTNVSRKEDSIIDMLLLNTQRCIEIMLENINKLNNPLTYRQIVKKIVREFEEIKKHQKNANKILRKHIKDHDKLKKINNVSHVSSLASISLIILFLSIDSQGFDFSSLSTQKKSAKDTTKVVPKDTVKQVTKPVTKVKEVTKPVKKAEPVKKPTKARGKFDFSGLMKKQKTIIEESEGKSEKEINNLFPDQPKQIETKQLKKKTPDFVPRKQTTTLPQFKPEFEKLDDQKAMQDIQQENLELKPTQQRTIIPDRSVPETQKDPMQIKKGEKVDRNFSYHVNSLKIQNDPRLQSVLNLAIIHKGEYKFRFDIVIENGRATNIKLLESNVKDKIIIKKILMGLKGIKFEGTGILRNQIIKFHK